MKAVLLAGGLGTRISEETRTKPMIEIEGMPILWHILKIYSHHGMNDFAPEHKRCIACNDQVIGIEWSLTQHGIISPQLSWKDLPRSSFNSATTGGL